MKKKKIGLALGGGTMRGMTHIGVMEVLKENKVPIDVLVGCSSGSLTAAAYACDRLGELKQFALSTRKKDGKRLLDFNVKGSSLIKGKVFRSLFDFITLHKNFEDLGYPSLAFVASDPLRAETVTINEGSISEGLEMTMGVPGLFPPKKYKGRLVVDGGATMIVPTQTAYDLGADFVIGVDVSVNRSVPVRLVGDIRSLLKESGLYKIASPIFKLQEKIHHIDEKKFLGKAKKFMQKIKLLDSYDKEYLNFIEVYLLGLRMTSADYKKGLFREADCDVSIKPDVLHVKRRDVTRMRELIKRGRKAAREALPKIKKALDI
jgi:NTE family protein